jgi:POT family proton-dependent oligopeptide transporter
MFADGAFRMPLIFLVLMYMLHTSGEMFMSPVGLSQMTKLSPLSIVSFVMAVWYMALAMANLFGGWIAGPRLDRDDRRPGAGSRRGHDQSLLVFKVIGLISIGSECCSWPVADPQEVVARRGRHRAPCPSPTRRSPDRLRT